MQKSLGLFSRRLLCVSDPQRSVVSEGSSVGKMEEFYMRSGILVGILLGTCQANRCEYVLKMAGVIQQVSALHGCRSKLFLFQMFPPLFFDCFNQNE